MSIPTNIVDAANQIRSGDLGTIDIIKITKQTDDPIAIPSAGDEIIVSALLGADIPDESTVTRRPVQAGFSVVDGVVNNPVDKTINVVLADPDFSIEAGLTAALSGNVAALTQTWRDKKQTLYDFKNNRDILTFTLHDDVITDHIISRIAPMFDVDDNWRCFIAEITFTPFDNNTFAASDAVGGAMTSGKQSVGGI